MSARDGLFWQPATLAELEAATPEEQAAVRRLQPALCERLESRAARAAGPRVPTTAEEWASASPAALQRLHAEDRGTYEQLRDDAIELARKRP